MKRTYRLVWNDALDVWVAIATRRSDPGKRRRPANSLHVLPGIAARTAGAGDRLRAGAA
jgi:hypothetical protein